MAFAELMKFLSCLKDLSREHITARKLRVSDETNILKSSTKNLEVPCKTQLIQKTIEGNLKLSTNEKLECCGKVFRYPCFLKKHVHIYHTSGVKCHICGERFSSKEALTSHEEIVHSKVGKRFICKICRVSLCSKINLNRHLSSKHFRPSPMKCKQCDYASRRPDLMKRHVTRKHLMPGNEIECYECKMYFSTKSSLLYHINCIHRNERVQCKQCFRSFKDEGELEIHMKFHMPGKNFLCPICGKAYFTFSHRERHLLVHRTSSKKRTQRAKETQSLVKKPKSKTKEAQERKMILNDNPKASNINAVSSKASSVIETDRSSTKCSSEENTHECDIKPSLINEDSAENNGGVSSLRDDDFFVDVETVNDEGSIYILPDRDETRVEDWQSDIGRTCESDITLCSGRKDIAGPSTSFNCENSLFQNHCDVDNFYLLKDQCQREAISCKSSTFVKNIDSYSKQSLSIQFEDSKERESSQPSNHQDKTDLCPKQDDIGMPIIPAKKEETVEVVNNSYLLCLPVGTSVLTVPECIVALPSIDLNVPCALSNPSEGKIVEVCGVKQVQIKRLPAKHVVKPPPRSKCWKKSYKQLQQASNPQDQSVFGRELTINGLHNTWDIRKESAVRETTSENNSTSSLVCNESRAFQEQPKSKKSLLKTKVSFNEPTIYMHTTGDKSNTFLLPEYFQNENDVENLKPVLQENAEDSLFTFFN